MALFGKLKKEKPVNGMIKYLGLEALWKSCSQEDKDALLRYYQSDIGTDRRKTLIEGNITFTTNTKFKFLSSMIMWAVSEKNYHLADKLIQAGENEPVDYGSLLDAHFFYQETAECFYKQRDLRPDATEQTEAFCVKDITILPDYVPIMEKEYGMIPRIVTVQRLAILYEKQGRIQEAIGLCDLAIKYGLSDNTKGGYQARLVKLKKKLS